MCVYVFVCVCVCVCACACVFLAENNKCVSMEILLRKYFSIKDHIRVKQERQGDNYVKECQSSWEKPRKRKDNCYKLF